MSTWFGKITDRIFGAKRNQLRPRREARPRLGLEQLERRDLLSASGLEAAAQPLAAAVSPPARETMSHPLYGRESVATPGVILVNSDGASAAVSPPTREAMSHPHGRESFATPGAIVVNPDGASPDGEPGQPNGFSPQQISQAYGFNQITFNNGTVQGNGAGQTIAIVDAYSQPNIVSDLAQFDSTYGLAAPPSFSVVNQTGGSTLPSADANWGNEESLDVEWAHAMAPQANIVLVEANSSSYSDLITAAVNYARTLPNVSVVSMSWGGGEVYGQSSYDSDFTTPSGHGGITFVAASGDHGSDPNNEPQYPSTSPNVLAVGGTQLTTDSVGDYQSETSWNEVEYASGGGLSALESQPSYQKGVVTQSSTQRAVPDVAYDAGMGVNHLLG